MNVTGWSKGLDVTADGEGVVSHAGLVLLRQLADKTGLTGGLSGALACSRLLIHDRGRVMADLACAIADGSEVPPRLAEHARRTRRGQDDPQHAPIATAPRPVSGHCQKHTSVRWGLVVHLSIVLFGCSTIASG